MPIGASSSDQKGSDMANETQQQLPGQFPAADPSYAAGAYKWQHPYALCSKAEVQAPDTTDSPGAEYIHDVQAGMADRWDNSASYPEGWPDENDMSDVAWQVAEDALPVATYEVARIFLDLCAWTEQDEACEWMHPDRFDFEQFARLCIVIAGQRIASVVAADIETANGVAS